MAKEHADLIEAAQVWVANGLDGPPPANIAALPKADQDVLKASLTNLVQTIEEKSKQPAS